MRRKINIFLSILLTINLLLVLSCPSFAAKKKKSSVGISTLEGTNEIFGSILNPNVNQVLLLLPKPLLNVIRRAGSAKTPIKVTSATDSTKSFNVPEDAVTVQKKTVNGKLRQVAVVNISNLEESESGALVTPSALDSGNYKLRIKGQKIDETTDSFAYEPPALVVGNVMSNNNKGFVNVEDLDGMILSDRPVAINKNGSFLTEVRGNKLKKKKKGKSRIIRFQTPSDGDTTGGSPEDAIPGVIHAVTDKDLYAIVPLNNNADLNAAKATQQIQVDEDSSLVANLAKENDDFAATATNDKLKCLADSDSCDDTSGTDPCDDIDQFEDRCTTLNDDKLLASIGSDFKDYAGSKNCDFPDFDLIKEYAKTAKSNEVGRGYCINIAGFEPDPVKPCDFYQELINISMGDLASLPCPPDTCPEFQNVKDCSKPIDFCRINETALAQTTNTPGCIAKPTKDLSCTRVGLDVTEEECINPNNTISHIVSTSSKGTKYCVPKELKESEASKTSGEKADFCDRRACHETCTETFGDIPKSLLDLGLELGQEDCDACKCHADCDGVTLQPKPIKSKVDCTDPKSKLFSIECCNISPPSPPTAPTPQRLAKYQTTSTSGFFDPNFGTPPPTGFFPPPPTGTFDPNFGAPPPTGTFFPPPPTGTFQPAQPPTGIFFPPPPTGTFQPVPPPTGTFFPPPPTGSFDPNFGGQSPTGFFPPSPTTGSFDPNFGGHPPPTAGSSTGGFDFSDAFGGSGGPKPNPGTGFTSPPIPDKKPIPQGIQDIARCLCNNQEKSFDGETGFVKDDAIGFCRNSCPEGYTKDTKSDNCLPNCDANLGLIRDKITSGCKSKCPINGIFDIATKKCRCRPGTVASTDRKSCIENTSPSTTNGCPSNLPIKCPDGSCKLTQADCTAATPKPSPTSSPSSSPFPPFPTTSPSPTASCIPPATPDGFGGCQCPSPDETYSQTFGCIK